MLMLAAASLLLPVSAGPAIFLAPHLSQRTDRATGVVPVRG
jgi:hypothetical protein